MHKPVVVIGERVFGLSDAPFISRVFSSDSVKRVGRPFRLLSLVDNLSRVSPAIECDFSLNGPRVVAVLERLKENGLPQTIKVDNAGQSPSWRLNL
jgi:hypothetical protein